MIAFSNGRNPRSKPFANEPGERDGQQRQVVVEQKGAREQAGADDRGGFRRSIRNARRCS